MCLESRVVLSNLSRDQLQYTKRQYWKELGTKMLKSKEKVQKEITRIRFELISRYATNSRLPILDYSTTGLVDIRLYFFYYLINRVGSYSTLKCSTVPPVTYN